LILVVIAIPLFVAGVHDVVDAFGWLREFLWWRATGENIPGSDWLVLWRPLIPAAWYLGLGAACSVAAARLFRGRVPEVTMTQTGRRSLITIGFIALVLLSEVVRLRSPAPELYYRHYKSPDSFTSIRGTVTDDAGNPLRGVGVELGIPEKADRDLKDWQIEETDASGGYKFHMVKHGTYVVVVNYSMAPSGERPYRKSFYPGVGSENAAARIAAVSKEPVILRPWALRRLPVSTIKAETRWSNGPRPHWSFLFVRNLAYRNGGAEEGFTIEDGTGQLVVPDGLEYEVTASATCDAGTGKENFGAFVKQRITAAPERTPSQMLFIIPRRQCTGRQR
jgi:hypothetical protein